MQPLYNICLLGGLGEPNVELQGLTELCPPGAGDVFVVDDVLAIGQHHAPAIVADEEAEGDFLQVLSRKKW